MAVVVGVDHAGRILSDLLKGAPYAGFVFTSQFTLRLSIEACFYRSGQYPIGTYRLLVEAPMSFAGSEQFRDGVGALLSDSYRNLDECCLAFLLAKVR